MGCLFVIFIAFPIMYSIGAGSVPWWVLLVAMLAYLMGGIDGFIGGSSN